MNFDIYTLLSSTLETSFSVFPCSQPFPSASRSAPSPQGAFSFAIYPSGIPILSFWMLKKATMGRHRFTVHSYSDNPGTEKEKGPRISSSAPATKAALLSAGFHCECKYCHIQGKFSANRCCHPFPAVRTNQRRR